MMLNESLAILMCMCHFAKSNSSIVEQARGAIDMKGDINTYKEHLKFCLLHECTSKVCMNCKVLAILCVTNS